jgi:sigma-B regulation protein RsbU (phosphoserine phosphatase)
MQDDHLGLVVADVSGHGLGPSLLMVETRALLRVVARNRIDPGEILTRANRVIAEDVEGRIYVTLLFVRLDVRTGDLLFANAGHPAGVILDARGEVRAQLRRTSGPLGFLRGAGPVSAPPLRLDPGDTLLLYTDGLKEARRPGETTASAGAGEEEEFGLDRILEIVRRQRDLGAAEIIRALCEAVRAFAAPEPLEDDLTVVVVRRAGAGA